MKSLAIIKIPNTKTFNIHIGLRLKVTHRLGVFQLNARKRPMQNIKFFPFKHKLISQSIVTQPILL